MNKRLILILCAAVLAFSQTGRYVMHGDGMEKHLGKVVIRGTGDIVSERQEGSPVSHYTGNIVIETDVLEIETNDIEYNRDTKEILTHGNIRVKLK